MAISQHAFKDLEEFRHVIYHEIGHHVFYCIITGAVRKKWVTEIYPGTPTITLAEFIGVVMETTGALANVRPTTSAGRNLCVRMVRSV